MQAIQIAYRDVDRTPLLYVLRELAAKHEGLDVNLVRIAKGDEYERRFLSGDLDVICEHLRFLFPARLAGHPVRCLAACQNHSVELLLARDGIDSVEDLAGQRIAIRATESSRISGVHWLSHLGLAGRTETLVVDDAETGRWQQWRKVIAGEADAVICSPLYQDAAIAAGLHVLPAPPLPEIGSLFLASLGPFVDRNEDILLRLVRSLYRALHAIHNDRDTAMAIIAGEPARLMEISGRDELERQFERLRASLDDRPVPRLDALATTFEMLSESYASLAGLEPLTLWDLRFVLELEEQRFLEQLDTALAEGGGRV